MRNDIEYKQISLRIDPEIYDRIVQECARLTIKLGTEVSKQWYIESAITHALDPNGTISTSDMLAGVRV